MKSFLFIGSLVLLLVVVGCSRKVVPSATSEVHDSTGVEIRYVDRPVKIPGEKVVVHDTVKCDKSTGKPIAQEIKAKSGRATVDVTIKGDGSVSATADCDSLNAIVKVMDSTIFRLRSDKQVRVQVIYQIHWYDRAARAIAIVVVVVGIGVTVYKVKKFLPI